MYTMSTPVTSTQGEVVEQVVRFAEQEAEIFARLIAWRPPDDRRRTRPVHARPVTPEHLVRWSREIAEALVCANDVRDSDPATASKIWARVRALIMLYTEGCTVDEFVILHLTRDQYDRFPYGLAVSDLVRLAEGRFAPSKIRSAMRRLARRGLIRACHTKRARLRPGSRLPVYEFLWFYSGPSSRYAESPERIYYMHTPWQERAREGGAA